MSATNPVREWLHRVANETGSPDKMETWGLMQQCENTKRLMVSYAQKWRSAQEGHTSALNGKRKA